MKNILVIIVILGLISSANAGISDALIFTVNGHPQPSEITLQPSQSIELGLELAAGHNVAVYDFQYRIIQGNAELIWSNVTFPMVFDFGEGALDTSPTQGVVNGYQLLGPPIKGPVVLMQGLKFDCLGPDVNPENPTILQVFTHGCSMFGGPTQIDGQGYPEGILIDSLIIHQVPEPATLLLLSLGGLFLKRKK